MNNERVDGRPRCKAHLLDIIEILDLQDGGQYSHGTDRKYLGSGSGVPGGTVRYGSTTAGKREQGAEGKAGFCGPSACAVSER